jgi:hypothetical protein
MALLSELHLFHPQPGVRRHNTPPWGVFGTALATFMARRARWEESQEYRKPWGISLRSSQTICHKFRCAPGRVRPGHRFGAGKGPLDRLIGAENYRGIRGPWPPRLYPCGSAGHACSACIQALRRVARRPRIQAPRAACVQVPPRVKARRPRVYALPKGSAEAAFKPLYSRSQSPYLCASASRYQPRIFLPLHRRFFARPVKNRATRLWFSYCCIQ